MEAKVYRAVLRILFSMGHRRREARRQFNDRWIMMVYLWSVINDRPVSGACDEQNWPKNQLDCPLPSHATMSRRLRTLGVLQLLERLADRPCVTRSTTAQSVCGRWTCWPARWSEAGNPIRSASRCITCAGGPRVASAS